MKSTRCVGPSSIGIQKIIIHEINEMILGYGFASWEHYAALVWIRERLKARLNA